jgi:hypothetical protein
VCFLRSSSGVAVVSDEERTASGVFRGYRYSRDRSVLTFHRFPNFESFSEVST